MFHDIARVVIFCQYVKSQTRVLSLTIALFYKLWYNVTYLLYFKNDKFQILSDTTRYHTQRRVENPENWAPMHCYYSGKRYNFQYPIHYLCIIILFDWKYNYSGYQFVSLCKWRLCLVCMWSWHHGHEPLFLCNHYLDLKRPRSLVYLEIKHFSIFTEICIWYYWHFTLDYYIK